MDKRRNIDEEKDALLLQQPPLPEGALASEAPNDHTPLERRLNDIGVDVNGLGRRVVGAPAERDESASASASRSDRSISRERTDLTANLTVIAGSDHNVSKKIAEFQKHQAFFAESFETKAT